MLISRNIINQAYQLSGVISLDEVCDGNDASTGVIKLNETLAQLNTEQLFPYSRKIVTHNVVSSKNFYTIGLPDSGDSTADIKESRPAFINRVFVYTNEASLPINMVQLDLPDLISRTLSTNTSGLPYYFGVNPQYPYSQIYFDIKPASGYIIKLVYNESIPLVNINSSLSIPTEYNDLIVCALARKLSVLKQMPDSTIGLVNQLYSEAKDRITSLNSRSQIPTYDSIYGNTNNNILSFNAQAVGY